MRIQALLLTLIIAGILGTGCSDVGFKSIPSQTCVDFNNGGDQTCVVGTSGNTYTVKFTTGQLDILFINDNSGSMSPEQQKMADAFPNFFNNIRNFDYQIAMTTTDMIATKGKLLEFEGTNDAMSGKFVLKKGNQSEAELLDLFKGTIQRDETIACDQSGYNPAVCPSSDERGIYAMNSVITNNQYSFLRPGAHLAIVVLSDEDQRGYTVWSSSEGRYVSGYGVPQYELQSVDYPETLVEKFASKFSSKTFSVHSVIVDSQSCKDAQTKYVTNYRGQTTQLKGFFGHLYNELSSNYSTLDQYGPIVRGSVSSICSTTYDSNLDFMSSLAAANALNQTVKMKCLPASDKITVTSSQTVNYSIDSANKSIVFTNVPPGVEVKVTYECPSSI